MKDFVNMRERVEKQLPMWARREFERLTKDLDGANAKLIEVAGDHGSELVVSAPYSDAAISLPDDVVRFQVDGGYIDVCRAKQGAALEIRSDGSFSSYPSITPQSSNSFEIRLIGRR